MRYRYLILAVPLLIPSLAQANSIPRCTDAGAVIEMDTTSPFPVTRFYSIVPQGVEDSGLHSITFSAPGIITPAVPLPPEGLTTVSFSASLNGSEILLPLGTLTCGTPVVVDTSTTTTPDTSTSGTSGTPLPETLKEPSRRLLPPRRRRGHITCAGVPRQAGENWRNGAILGYPCPRGRKPKTPITVAVAG